MTGPCDGPLVLDVVVQALNDATVCAHNCAHNWAPGISPGSSQTSHPASVLGRLTVLPVSTLRRAASCAGDVIGTCRAAAAAATSGSQTRPLERDRVLQRPAQN